MSGPHDPTKSTYSLPSASRTRAPLPLTTNGGVPPTAPNEADGTIDAARDQSASTGEELFRVVKPHCATVL